MYVHLFLLLLLLMLNIFAFQTHCVVLTMINVIIFYYSIFYTKSLLFYFYI